MRNLLMVLSFALLTACGGGSDSGSTPTPTPTPQPADPTLTVTQENTSCEIAQECLVLTAEASKNATAATITLSGIDSAIVEVSGERTQVTADGTVSFSASQSFKLFVTHSIAENLTLSISNFTVDGTQYSANASVDVEFIAPDANARLDMVTLQCGEVNCTGTLYADTLIEGVNFTLDDSVSVTLETSEGTYSSQDGLITFPATTQANVTFSTTGLSVQQVYRLTTNTFDSVIVSGNVQEVGESLELSFDRSANVFVSMTMPTIYGGADVTTDASYEVKGIKQVVVQYGPGIETHRERVLLESVTYSFLKWNIETSQFDVVNSGTIESANGLSQSEAESLSFYADTIPWVYRIEVSATLNGEDVLKHSKTFVKREDDDVNNNNNLTLHLFPHEITGERVDQLHTEYDALEEGAEFSSTLANLYPREYKDENGNLNPATCFYAWELNGMFPSVSSDANIDLKTYCNVNTPFSIADIETETSMMLSVTSQQHDDLVERDFALPSSNIYVEYEAQKGSNIVDFRFYSFAHPGTTEMSLIFPTGNITGLDTLIVFDVAN